MVGCERQQTLSSKQAAMIWVLAALSLLALPGVWGQCGGKFKRDGTGPADIIMSPGYADGNNYPDGASCTFVFKSDNYQLSFILHCPDGQFDVVEKNRCKEGDRMRVTDGETLGDKFCGTHGPQMVMSGKPYLKVSFKSNNDGMTAMGFNCTVSTIVDTSYTTPLPRREQNFAAQAAANDRVYVPPQGYKCTCGETNTRKMGVSRNAPGSMSHPWLAAIQPVGETIPRCAGAIINDRHVLTAASCADIPDLQVIRLLHRIEEYS